MTWQLDTELDVDLRWIIGNGHGARTCGDDRWNPLVTVMAQGHVATIGGAYHLECHVAMRHNAKGGDTRALNFHTQSL
jgi:hypothetical protein